MKIHVPPIKCQGIKTKLVPIILEYIYDGFKGKWIEPFMGSGVVGFNVRHNNAIFNDINPHIISFYKNLKEGNITPQITRKYLENEGGKLSEIGEEYYYEVRNRFNENKNSLDFLFLSRSCFNGILRFNRKGGYNVPFCKKPERFSKSYITKIVNQVNYVYEYLKSSDCDMICNDFKSIISNASKNDFIYCDPPYYGRHVDYFNSWTEEDEFNLFQELSKTRAKFILSTWKSNRHRENPSIEKYLKDFHIITKEHFYHIGGKEENRNPMIEALILNYQPVKNKTTNKTVDQLSILKL